ncbi:tRNA lysidine(34) synthetase TilS [Bacillus sp. MRMR6]|uniref:tRNA lysidine(34) synthetase TilS n=1 Tax=Bacillus sp. MRMR6 TaxID=1928617 RepID=UPI0009533703|nr:tRNA lysidine(34) synthetase TilS [Bacillus sp. MRMR6]OLS34130.1 tRNA lysidine(34) synthetase TilS [Bacillus sp. MRMR6]
MLEAKVAAFLNHNSYSFKNKKMVVGVSGGPDSLALLHFLWGQRKTYHFSIVAAHVDHMFRGQESFEDALFVKSFCHQNNIPFEMARIDVPELSKKTKKSSQIAAREARYGFYKNIMEKYNYPYLVLGHHGDDQVETILMRLTRGSSGTARAGIPFKRTFGSGFLLRPFLGITKTDIESYCHRHHLQPRIDPSNEKGVYSRNRFRKVVLPFLKSENQNVHEHFQRFSEELNQDEIFLQELTVQKMNTVMTIRKKGKITIDNNRFLEMPLPLQRRGIHLILNYLYNEKPASLSALHTDQILSLVKHPHPSAALDLPSGLKVIKSYDFLSFQFELMTVENYYFELKEPGVVVLPSGTMIKMVVTDQCEMDLNTCCLLLDADQFVFPIKIRTRRMGDRMTLKGMSGTKKLKDIFIDGKIPIQDRDSWPVITDGNDNILWLPGLKKSSFEGIKHPASHYILLTYQK